MSTKGHVDRWWDVALSDEAKSNVEKQNLRFSFVLLEDGRGAVEPSTCNGSNTIKTSGRIAGALWIVKNDGAPMSNPTKNPMVVADFHGHQSRDIFGQGFIRNRGARLGSLKACREAANAFESLKYEIGA